MNTRKLPKLIVGHGIGIVAVLFAIHAVPDFHLFSSETLLLIGAFTLVSVADGFLDAAKLNAWPWDTELKIKNDSLAEPRRS